VYRIAGGQFRRRGYPRTLHLRAPGAGLRESRFSESSSAPQAPGALRSRGAPRYARGALRATLEGRSALRSRGAPRYARGALRATLEGRAALRSRGAPRYARGALRATLEGCSALRSRGAPRYARGALRATLEGRSALRSRGAPRDSARLSATQRATLEGRRAGEGGDVSVIKMSRQLMCNYPANLRWHGICMVWGCDEKVTATDAQV